jgi:hypothetical protein
MLVLLAVLSIMTEVFSFINIKINFIKKRMFIGFDILPLVFSLVTSVLFKPKAQTQKVGKRESLVVDPSGYSTPVTFFAGRVRAVGLRTLTVPLRERKKIRKSKNVKQKIYSYYFTSVISIGIPLQSANDPANPTRRQPYRIAEIYFNNELYYNKDTDVTVDRFDANGNYTGSNLDGKNIRTYSGGGLHELDSFINREIGDYRYNGQVYLVISDLNIEKWSGVPDVEVIIEPYERNYRPNGMILIESIGALANLPSTAFSINQDVANQRVEGYYLAASDNNLATEIEKVASFLRCKIKQKGSVIVVEPQYFTDPLRTKSFQTSLDCIEGESYGCSGESRIYKNAGFTISFSDMARRLDKTEYTHQLASGGSYEQNIESVDMSQISMTVDTAYLHAEYLTSQNQHKYNNHVLRLTPRYNIDIEPNDVVVVNDDLFTKQTILGIIDKVTFNVDWTIDVAFSDFPLQIILANLEDNDLNTAPDNSENLAFSGTLFAYPVPLLLPEDYTASPQFNKAQYVALEQRVGAVDVYLSFDGGVEFTYAGDLSGKRVQMTNNAIIPSGTGYNPGQNIDFTVSPLEIDDVVGIVDENDVQEGGNLIIDLNVGEVISVRSMAKIAANQLRISGVFRSWGGVTYNGTYAANTVFDVLKVDFADLAETIRIRSGLATGTQVFYKLVPARYPYNANAPTKSFIYTGNI